MSAVRAEITGIMPPADFPGLDLALPVLWAHVRELPVREAHRDFVRSCIGPDSGDGVADCLARGGHWSITLYVGGLTDWTAHPITLTTHRP